MDPYVGEIRAMAFPFAPKGWALCNGQLLSIAQNTALYSLLGNYFGGDGRSTFGLPNFQARVVVGVGQGPGTSQYTLGQVGGASTVTLLSTQMPAHVHTLPMNTSNVTTTQSGTPGPGVVLGGAGGGGHHAGGESWYVSAQTQSSSSTNMSSSAVGLAGGDQPHNNMQPFLTLSYCIALLGIYPSRP